MASFMLQAMSCEVLVLVGMFVAVFSNDDYCRDYPPISFTCPPLPPLERPARNVYELRPQDIKVAMAFGDSITAGTFTRFVILC